MDLLSKFITHTSDVMNFVPNSCVFTKFFKVLPCRIMGFTRDSLTNTTIYECVILYSIVKTNAINEN